MSTLFIGKNTLFLEHVHSTNSYLMELLSNSKPLAEGTVIMAVDQSAGRGQQGKVWESEAGKNLSISVLLYPGFIEAHKQFYISKIISLAVHDLLKLYLPGVVHIKWPNDLYYSRRKVAGILIENVLAGNQIRASVIGIGLNVNQTEFPEHLPNPASVKSFLGVEKDIDLNRVLQQLCGTIEKRYLQLKNKRFFEIDEEYLQALYQLEEYAAYLTPKGKENGTITGITQEGKLQILFNQTIEEFDTQQIQFLL